MRESSFFVRSADARAERHRIVQKDHLRNFLSACQNHAVALHSAQLCGRKIAKNHNLFSEQHLRLIGFGNAGNDLSRLRAEIYLKAQQLIRFRNALCLDDLSAAQLKL